METASEFGGLTANEPNSVLEISRRRSWEVAAGCSMDATSRKTGLDPSRARGGTTGCSDSK